MQENVHLLRAIGSVFLRRLLMRVALVPAGVLLACFLLVSYLTLRVDATWWLGIGFLMIVSTVVLGVFVLTWLAASKIAPKKLSRIESRSIAIFTDKLLGVVEQARTPLPVLALKLTIDAVLYRDIQVLQRIIEESKTLHAEYQRLRSLH